MIAMKSANVEIIQVGAVRYKGESSEAKHVDVQWLSKVGQDAEGSPAYGLIPLCSLTRNSQIGEIR
jgi:hypothetical protein